MNTKETHYDAKSGEFSERRSPSPTELAIVEIATEFRGFRTEVRKDLEDFNKRLEGFMTHSDMTQRGISDNIQRQLDQNNEQHKEIVSIFKEEMGKLVKQAETRVDMMQQIQAREDQDQNRRLGCIETEIGSIKGDVKSLKEAKVATKAGHWDKLLAAGIGVFITMMIGGVMYVVNGIISAAKSTVGG